MARTGLSRSSIYRKVSQQTFPNQVYLGERSHSRSVGWLESEIDNWLSIQIERSRLNQGNKNIQVVDDVQINKKIMLSGKGVTHD